MSDLWPKALPRELQQEEEQFSWPRLEMFECKVQRMLGPDSRGRHGHERTELLPRRRCLIRGEGRTINCRRPLTNARCRERTVGCDGATNGPQTPRALSVRLSQTPHSPDSIVES